MRIAAFAISLSVPALVTYTLFHQRNQALADAEIRAVNTARALEQHAARTFETIDTYLRAVASLVGPQAAALQPDAIHAALREQFAHSRLNNIMVIDPNGRAVVEAVEFPARPLDVHDRDYFKALRDRTTSSLFAGQPITGRLTGRRLLPIARRINNPDGTFGGLVQAMLDLETFQNVHDAINNGPGATLNLWRADGTLLVRSPRMPEVIGRNFADRENYRLHVPGKDTKPFWSHDLTDGVERVIALSFLDGYPLYVGAALSKADALADWRQSTVTQASIAGVLTLVLVAALLLLAREIERRRIADARIRANEERYRLLSEAATDMVTHIDLSGRRLYVSPASRDLLGYEPNDLIGTSPQEAIHPDDAESFEVLLGDLTAARRERGINVNRQRHRDGHWVWVEASLKRLQDATGRTTGFVASVRNIDARKADEAALLAARAEAERASAAKSEFLAAMSHEIRTPLNGVIGYADLLCAEPDLASAARRHTERIRSAGAALLTVVNDVLDFSKIEAGQVEITPCPFSPLALIDNAVSIVGGHADAKGLALDVFLDPALPGWLLGDENRLRQVLLNLLNNAVKFTKHGRIGLHVDCDEAAAGSVRLRLAVADTGIGIPAGRQDRLFRRFSQVDGSISRDYGGTGLGLAISKALVERMGGTIGFESELGRGSTFWFEVAMPLAAAPSVPVSRALHPRIGRRILLAEDVPLNQELACAILTGAGHAVDVVGDGAAAVAAVRARTYDLVLMDVQMPGTDGLAATRQIRGLAGAMGRVPIVALTANVLPQQIVEFRAAGMDDHVGKPFRGDELFAAIDRWTGPQPQARPAPSATDEQTRATQVDPAVLDAAVLQAVETSFGADRVGRLLDLLANELSERFRPTEIDRLQIVHDAHAMISAAGMLGFVGLSNLCREVEVAAHAGDDLMPLIRRLEGQRAQALHAIHRLRAA